MFRLEHFEEIVDRHQLGEALTTNFGRDIVARSVGGDTTGIADTATGATATTLTATGTPYSASSGGPPENGGFVGHIVVAGTTAANFAYGVILKNSTSVLTIDQWHNFTAPETVASTPSTTAPYVIAPGGLPCFYMGITANATAPAASDTTLTAEVWNSGGGVRRRLATWAHTNGNATYTVANTYTANGSDALPVTLAKIGIFQAFVNAAVTTSNSGPMLFTTLLSATATLSASGDNVAVTDTVTIS
jgi:hypothetical protein